MINIAEYYFDIETYSPKRPNPDEDKIITIQFQEIDLKTGKPKGDLVILKEWKSSEKEIVTHLYNEFFRDRSNVWKFVPVGFNLNFEWEFLMTKFKKYLNVELTSRDVYYNTPQLDVKPIIVLLNDGKFRGAKLDKFTNKQQDGKVIKEWYKNGHYNKIEQYIRNETESFLEFLQKIMKNIHKLGISPIS